MAKLSTAQTAVLDKASRYPHLHGVAVVREGMGDNRVPLSTARSLVKQGHLVEVEDGLFRRAADAVAQLPAQRSEPPKVSVRKAVSLRKRARTPEEAAERVSKATGVTEETTRATVDGLLRALVPSPLQRTQEGMRRAVVTTRRSFYEGTVTDKVKKTRRAKGKVAKASRKTNRGRG